MFLVKRHNLSLDKILEKIYNKLDLLDRRTILKMRENGHLFYLSELTPYFKGTKLFAFGNGGSITNLNGVERLKNFNLIMTSFGPLYMSRLHGFVPNIWTLTYGPIARIILREEKKSPIDFLDTFILLPANDSESKIWFSSPVVKKFRKAHPEATYILYRETQRTLTPNLISERYLKKDREPLFRISRKGNTLDSLFLPICFYLGVFTVYFSGIDLITTTGHFWDRHRLYQSIDGVPIDFPDPRLSLRCAKIVQRLCKQNNKKVYRLEKKETILNTYPYLEFEKALKEASPKITPQMIRQNILK